MQKSSARRERRNRKREPLPAHQSPARPGIEGGRYAPLRAAEVSQFDAAIREILTTIGMAEAPPFVIETVTARGGTLREDGRLLFPNALIDEALAGFVRNVTLHGQRPQHDMLLTGARVHVGTGGAAPQVVDLETGRYRDSTLRDLYDAARIVDTLENVHFFSRSLVARDMPTEYALDLNTAYASLIGTTKHVCTSATQPEHVQPIAEICHAIAGSREAFLARPFLSLNINHVVPPLRFAEDACGVMAEAARLGIPIHANAFGQLGASSPVTIAGSVVQNVAEVLAGMIFAWLLNPELPIIFGARPMVTDLRTGAMSGGGGEQASMMAITTQMAQFYDLPNSSIAGATDSKIPDAQSGYEKSMAVTLAAQAGSNMITQACGTQASLGAVAFESYVIDNEMIGAVLRSISPLEVDAETLAVAVIDEVVRGDGHFLGHAQTFARMQSDFLYPQVADRRSPQEWEDDGAPDMRAVAKQRTQEILASHVPDHVSVDVDRKIRERFEVYLR